MWPGIYAWEISTTKMNVLKQAASIEHVIADYQNISKSGC